MLSMFGESQQPKPKTWVTSLQRKTWKSFISLCIWKRLTCKSN